MMRCLWTSTRILIRSTSLIAGKARDPCRPSQISCREAVWGDPYGGICFAFYIYLAPRIRTTKFSTFFLLGLATMGQKKGEKAYDVRGKTKNSLTKATGLNIMRA